MPAPTRIAQLVPYLSAHAAIIKAAPATFGVPAAAANDFDLKAKALASAFDEATSMREKSKGATAVQTEALREASAAFASLVEIIRGFANTTANPAAVLAAAQIDPIAPPTPAGPPAPVAGVKVGVDIASGNLVVSWKSSNNGTSGTSFTVSRRLPGAAAFTFMGVAPASGPSGKKFTDSTLPIGTDFVEYSITPVRSGLSGTATTVMVRFGSVGGEQTATLVETNGEGGVKLAA